jgi:hypothetical protein
MDRPEDDFWHIPYFPSIYFTGREKELQEMREHLSKRQAGITVRIQFATIALVFNVT